MYFKRIHKKQGYYVCCSHEKNIVISTSMSYIADYMGISQRTLSRHFKHSDIYTIEGFTVCKNVKVHTIKRGFALS